jgi:hypothetical protein
MNPTDHHPAPRRALFTIARWLLVLLVAASPMLASAQDSPSRVYRVTGISENDTLIVRSGPGASYSIVARLDNNHGGIRITGSAQMNGRDDWVPISFGGNTGWVRPKYLEAISSDAPPSTAAAPPTEDDLEARWKKKFAGVVLEQIFQHPQYGRKPSGTTIVFEEDGTVNGSVYNGNQTFTYEGVRYYLRLKNGQRKVEIAAGAGRVVFEISPDFRRLTLVGLDWNYWEAR